MPRLGVWPAHRNGEGSIHRTDDGLLALGRNIATAMSAEAHLVFPCGQARDVGIGYLKLLTISGVVVSSRSLNSSP